jgi:hypothetical protein
MVNISTNMNKTNNHLPTTIFFSFRYLKENKNLPINLPTKILKDQFLP